MCGIIEPIAAFETNYIWLLHNGTHASVVDPGDGRAVLHRLRQRNLTLENILITHHHADHTGGIETLLGDWAVPVYGPESYRIPEITNQLYANDRLPIAAMIFDILFVPGHTNDHIAYFASDNEKPILFCGDTLFAGGCGRLFEGTAQTMVHSLHQISQLPPETSIYCAHEYTMANLRFAIHIEPHNPNLQARLARTLALREQNRPTIPSQLHEELATNPFLRCDQPAIIAAAERYAGTKLNSIVSVFEAIREYKDNFAVN